VIAGGVLRRAGRLLMALPTYAHLAWWGIGAPRREREPLVVYQAVIFGPAGVLLAMRGDLHGWELPGGSALLGESPEDALRREIYEETGLAVADVSRVGDYERSGFRPHIARVYRCRAAGGVLRTSAETRAVAWFDPTTLPRALFPWYRGPLADALSGRTEPVAVREHQGWRYVLAGMAIDLAVRWRGPERAVLSPRSG
jgi:ADP-ribose pyrophosphatase YjhB (NUDIX family)